MTGSRIGVVLSSGGGRGVFGHTGFMLALDELGIPVQASAGCSAGAVVGGVVASGSKIRDWAHVLARITAAQMWSPRSPWRLLFDLGYRKGRGLSGLSDTTAAIRFLTKQLSAQTFEECQYPFAAVALNLGTVKKTIFDTGLLAPRLMASAAMPGIYEPVEIDGEYFTDGAIIDLAPAEAICCQHKLDVLLVHHVAQRHYNASELSSAFQQPWTIVNILHRLIYRRRPWYATGQSCTVHTCPCGCHAVIVVIEPELQDLVWPLTTGGDAIVGAAQSQTLAELLPLLESLTANPRSLLG